MPYIVVFLLSTLVANYALGDQHAGEEAARADNKKASANLPYGFLELSSEEIPKKIAKSLKEVSKAIGKVELRRKDDGSLLSTGTGFVIEPGNQMMTAHHVLETWIANLELVDAFLILPEEEDAIKLTEVVKEDPEADQVTAKLEKTPLRGIKVLDEELKAGLQIAAVGHPYSSKKPFATLGVTGHTEKGKLYLSNPSLPGMSGAPGLVIRPNGEIAGALGVLHGIQQPFVDAQGFGQRFDISGMNEINRRLYSLYSVEDPKKTLEMKEKNGKYSSDIVANYYEQVTPMIFATHNNRKIAVRKDVIEPYTKVLDKLEDEVAKLISLNPRSVGQRLVALQALERVNRELKGLSELMVNQTRVSFNPPILDRKEAESWTNRDFKDSMERYLARVQSAKKQYQSRIEAMESKNAYVESTDAIIQYMLELDEKPEKKETAEHFNDRFLHTPALLNKVR